jgi:glucose/arabinose dehydrogenase
MKRALPIAIALAATLAGCTAEATPTTQPTTAAPTISTPSTTATPTPEAVEISGEPTVLTTDLESPWSMVRLSSGSTLISLRDTGRVVEYTAAGDVREVGVIADVAHRGEGGLLGLAVSPADEGTLFAYLTTASDNRIVKLALTGDAGSYELGDEEVVLDGLAAAQNHNGGRIAFGPDGMLYATVGDAGEPSRAQDLDSLNGKILRMTADGDIPADNPYDSLVWSYGHRNPQGIAWDDTGQLFASEFGQDTWDEFNRIEAGGNYGWPEVEGETDDDSFINPLFQWATDDASPSGLAYVDGTFFMASLKGARVWQVYPDGEPVDTASGYGRLRDVAAGPDGTLWVLTNNTDGRGSPAVDDDRILQFDLAALESR